MAAHSPTAAELAGEAAEEVARLEHELAEIELLVQQARNESSRHEAKRTQSQERVAQLSGGRSSPAELIEATNQLLTATRRASLMDAQIDVLVGKQRALGRFRERLQHYADAFAAVPAGAPTTGAAEVEEGTPSFSRAILDAQEVLRRDISRAMHDGPAQSLTNIALQAQIVERLIARDPERAAREVHELVAMVQHTLEATKTFIFDVRPMVLDDLGIVPTLRRAARDRGRAAQIPVEFDSVGQDRRLGSDLESGLFRVIDDAIVGFLSTTPARVAVRLDWGDTSVRAVVRGMRNEETLLALPPGVTGAPEPDRGRAALGRAAQGEDLPPALAAMIQERGAEADATAAAAAEAVARAGQLPAGAWKAVGQRAHAAGISVVLSEDGAELAAEAAYPA
jgi:two-component system sensor histidine kinase DegS